MNRDEPEIDEFDDLIESVEEEMGKLASDAKDTRRELLDFYETKIEEWTGRGYNTVRIEEAMSLPLEEMEKEFARFTNDVDKLESLRESANRFNLKDLKPEIDNMALILFEPGREDEARREIEELSSIVRAREEGRKGWLDKVNWLEEEWILGKDLLEWQL